MEANESGVGSKPQDRRLAIVRWLLQVVAALVHGQVTPIWPPTGIALVAILVFGRWIWPGIFLAAFAVNLPIGPTPLGAALIAAGNTLAPVTAAALLRQAGFQIELSRLRDAAAIIVLGGLVAMTLSATIGSSVLVLFGTVPADNFPATWTVWWTGDAMGVLLVAPFLLSLLPSRRFPTLAWRKSVELGALLVGIALITFLLFQNSLRLEYLVFPLIMLAAWRFRLRGAAPAALIASGIAIWTAVHASGPFAAQSLVQKMITLQVFNVCVALTSFVLAAFVEARERAEEMRRLYLSATVASQTKSVFLDMAAHGLLTPLTVLSGYLSLLSEGSLGAPATAWEKPLDILIAKTREMEKIVDDLLRASRLDAGDPPSERELLDLRTVVGGAVSNASPRADLLGAAIKVDVPADPVFVEAEADHLGRALDELINNALTYTTRTPEISIVLSTEARRAVVRMADNGVGIKDEDQERIFDRLYRVADTPVDVPGIGLGLYISRRLVESYRGVVALEASTPGEGSIFALSLPLAQSARN